MFQKRTLVSGLILVGFLLAGVNVSRAAPPPQMTTLTGWFSILWGDPKPGTNLPPTETYFLTDDKGTVTQVLLDGATIRAGGGVLALNRQRVQLVGVLTARAQGEAAVMRVQSVQRLGPETPAQVEGTVPWISIGCKFADVSWEPVTVAFLKSMYSSSYPGLIHYWKEQSYNRVDLTGSDAVGWFTLPQSKAYYQTAEGFIDLTKAARDCTGVADSNVHFENLDGINLMFNSDIGLTSVGGSRWLTLDGVSRNWRVTWLMDWAYMDLSVVEHEMGHGFGLPHSSGNYGATYDNQWDVMSSPNSNCERATDPVFGCLGQHTIAWHKSFATWIPSQGVMEETGVKTFFIEALALPWSGAVKEVDVLSDPSGSHMYTLEARKHIGYDTKLPGQGVILHETDWRRWSGAHVIDIDNNGNTGDDGAIWSPGEMFVDAAEQIYVCVNSETSTGYNVTVGVRVVPTCAKVGTATPTATATATRTLTRTPTVTRTPAGDWLWCARQNQTCNLPGTRLVRYGANGAYLFKTLAGSFACSNETFGGNPLYGVTKDCDYNINPNAPTPTNTLTVTPTQTATATATSSPTATATLACQSKPGVPQLTSPKNGALVKKKQATLKWLAGNCADTYTVVVRESGTHKQVEKHVGLKTLEYKTTKLQSLHTYEWRVTAVNAFGQRASGWRTLTIK